MANSKHVADKHFACLLSTNIMIPGGIILMVNSKHDSDIYLSEQRDTNYMEILVLNEA